MPDPARPDPDEAPSQAALSAWLDAAQTGSGTPWLPTAHAAIFAGYARDRGFGVSLMEASTAVFTEPPRDTDWEILGADTAGDNWADHRDPARAFALFERKLRRARRDGARLQYKLWIQPGA